MRGTIDQRPRHAIEIVDLEGETCRIHAEVVGQWAVHGVIPHKGKKPTGKYTVTYIRDGHPESGKTITRLINEGLDRSGALRIAEVFAALLGDEPLDLEKHKPMLSAELDKFFGPSVVEL